MKAKILAACAIAVVFAALGAAVAMATDAAGLVATPLARGAAGEFRIQDKSLKLAIEARRPTDVSIVKATLDPGGTTGWHSHPGSGVVVLKSGTLDVSMPHHNRCHTETVVGPKTFVHSESTHEFVNTGADVAEFYVVYFVPAGATPLLTSEPVPPECQ